MTINITMLNVGDADAIIVHLQRSEKEQLVILIDGGHSADGKDCIDKLSPILKKANKFAPDLIVCTHYDADHILGLKNVVNKYGNNIRQIWMHHPGVIQNAIHTAESQLLSLRMDTVRPISENFQQFKKSTEADIQKLVLESYSQMEKLITDIKRFEKIELIEPFFGTEFPKWPELQVLGPTKKFYDECVDRMKDVPTLINEEKEELIDSTKRSILYFEEFKKEILSSCEQLAKQKKDKVSSVNQISIVLKIEIEKEKYLFTGDASLESFKAIPGYPEAIKDIHWLKVPHHGSHNNSSPELFDIMTPKFADISGGDRYLDDIVIDCLKAKKVQVRTTRDVKADLIFPYPTT